MYSYFSFYTSYILLQGSIPDLGNTALNIAAWLLVVIGGITITLLWHIYKKLDARISTIEERQWNDSKETNNNKNTLRIHKESIDELKEYQKEIHTLITKNMEPRLSKLEYQIKDNGKK